jgi:MFS family permease
MFYITAAVFAVEFVFALFQPRREQSLRAPVLTGLRELFSQRDFVVFIVCMFLVGMSANGALAFFSLYMQRLGAKEGLIGISWAVPAGAEAVTIALSGMILRKISTRNLLKIGFFTYAVRWLLLSFVTDPIVALATQLLHGLSFAPFLVAGVTYVHERTPEGMGATAQSLYLLVSFGLASIAGSLIGGFLFDRLPPELYFRLMSLVTAIGFALFVVIAPRGEKAKGEEAVG